MLQAQLLITVRPESLWGGPIRHTLGGADGKRMSHASHIIGFKQASSPLWSKQQDALNQYD